MPREMPYNDPLPDEIDIRRDALLLRIVELRQAVTDTTLDPETVSKELDELYKRVQTVEGLKDMGLFEELFDTIEKIVDVNK